MPKTKTSQTASVLTPYWKAAFRAGWVDERADEEEIDYYLDGTDTVIETRLLASHRLGPYLVIPTMSDDQESCVRVLAVAGFIPERAIAIPVGNSDCEALVFVDDPDFVGERGVLVSCGSEGLFWQVLLK